MKAKNVKRRHKARLGGPLEPVGSVRLPPTWGQVPELPAAGPRPLTTEDLKGFSKRRWGEIIKENKLNNRTGLAGSP